MPVLIKRYSKLYWKQLRIEVADRANSVEFHGLPWMSKSWTNSWSKITELFTAILSIHIRSALRKPSYQQWCPSLCFDCQRKTSAGCLFYTHSQRLYRQGWFRVYQSGKPRHLLESSSLVSCTQSWYDAFMQSEQLVGWLRLSVRRSGIVSSKKNERPHGDRQILC